MLNSKSTRWDHFWARQKSSDVKNISWSKQRILKILEPHAFPGKNALDAGCGSGFFSNYFCDRKMDTVSLDYSQKALDIAQQKTAGRTKIIKADLLNEKLSALFAEPFDLIFSDGLFEHFEKEDQDKIMLNLRTVIAVDGVLITVVPNRWSPWQLIRPVFMPGIKETPFVWKGLLDLNQRNGFSVIAKGGLNVFPFKVSPEKMMASQFGMLLFTIAVKNKGCEVER